MIEKPLDRLNYYNGQRLEASDLKLEQEYHIRTRRWINKSLYTAGIARGLDIRAEKDTRFVIVSPGLALDAEGQEILLLEEERISVPGKAHTNNSGSEAKVEGLYLTIRYNEKAIEEERNGCISKSTNGKKNGDRASWGGPALMRAKPLFNWSDTLPYESSGEIVLAQVELTPDCSKVHQLNTGVRRYVGAASSSKVHQYALEGERHIDKDNPGRIYFHIRGRQPKAVTLYLRAEKFSTLFYTEMGQHNHTNSATGFSVNIPQHSHPITPITDPDLGVGTGPAGGHTPSYSDIRGRVSGILTDIPLVNEVWGFTQLSVNPPDASLRDVSLAIWAGVAVSLNPVLHHVHALPTTTELESQKTIPLGGTGNSSNAGVSDISARVSSLANPEDALTFVDDLQVWIGPDIKRLTNQTASIVNQLRAAQPTQPTVTWDKLGNGGDGHALAVKGTGEIKLDFLPNIAFTEGEYVIQLSVNSGGGRVLYNLYVE